MKKKVYNVSLALIALSTLFLSACEKEDKDAISMEEVNKGIQTITTNGKEYMVVDLGLASGNLWPTCNIGADSPEEAGLFFAWGEKQPKTSYEWDSYLLCDGDGLSLNKYCTNATYGKVDNITQLELTDEAPGTILGEGWRIPTESDFRELLTSRNCEAKWCKLNGVGGFLFTSVRKGYEGNSIFIPLAGMKDHSSIRFAEEYGWLWCNSIYYNGEKSVYVTTDASVLCLQHNDVDNHIISSRTRYLGLPIRPVYVGE